MVSAFQDQLDMVNGELVQMTRLVGSAMNRATQALLDADLTLAESVIAADAQIDTLASDIEERCFDLIAIEQPDADDLRMAIGALRIATSLERMGDLAEHVAKQARLRYPRLSIPQELRGTFAEMGGLAEAIVSKTGAVIATQDVGPDRGHRPPRRAGGSAAPGAVHHRPVLLMDPRGRGGDRRDAAVPVLRAVRRPRGVRHASRRHVRDRRAVRGRLAHLNVPHPAARNPGRLALFPGMVQTSDRLASMRLAPGKEAA